MPAGKVGGWLDWHWLNHRLVQNLWYFVLSVSLLTMWKLLCMTCFYYSFFWENF